MSVKINQFELENVKRIKAVKVELSENGLTVIGGRNSQGKTSILDSKRDTAESEGRALQWADRRTKRKEQYLEGHGPGRKQIRPAGAEQLHRGAGAEPAKVHEQRIR